VAKEGKKEKMEKGKIRFQGHDIIQRQKLENGKR